MINREWKLISESKPLCTETGDWDGKKSSEVLLLTESYKHFIGTCYEGFLDGSYFFTVLDQDDCDITEFVFAWSEIPPLLF